MAMAMVMAGTTTTDARPRPQGAPQPSPARGVGSGMRRVPAFLLLPLLGCGSTAPVAVPAVDASVASDGSAASDAQAALDGGADDATGGPDASSDDATPMSSDASTPEGCGVAAPIRAGVVRTTRGVAVGTSLAGGTHAWLGLPYAAPPVGRLRWAPPEPAACWAEERSFTTLGQVCPQEAADGTVSGSEDCLTLNVWAQGGATSAPVMVFIHGGGNKQGTAHTALYDGQVLASEQGVVVVVINYRLGALGFFSHDALDRESAHGVSGNYGILDQQAALRWVQDNIAAFGGDPARVLVFGESAGAQDSMIHLVSPLSRGLASSILVQSGGVYSTTLADGKSEMRAVVEAVGCAGQADELSCLRAVTPEALATVPAADGPLARGLHYKPVIDGYVIPDNPLTMLTEGRFNPVSFTIGTNADETSRMVPAVSSEAEYQQAVMAQYGPLAPRILQHYPASNYPTPRDALVRVTTDITWTCNARRIARLVDAGSALPVYRYFFSWVRPGAVGARIGATHGIELPFVFGTYAALSGFVPDPAAVALGQSVRAHWASLAATGQTSTSVAVTWPAYDSSTDVTLELTAPPRVLQGVRTADCDFLASLVPGGT